MRPLIFSLLFFLFSFSTFSQTLNSLEKEQVQKEYRKFKSEPLFMAKKGASIWDEPSEKGKILLKLIEAVPIFQVVNFTEKYFYICLEKKCGYISFQNLEINPESEAYKSLKERREKRLLEIELKPFYKNTGKGSGYSSL